MISHRRRCSNTLAAIRSVAHTLYSANNNGERRLLRTANRMVAFHDQQVEALRSGTTAKLVMPSSCRNYNDRISSGPPSATEYIHILINPLPIYGLAIGWIGLVIAFFLRSRPAQIAALILVLISAASAWPANEFGEASLRSRASRY